MLGVCCIKLYLKYHFTLIWFISERWYFLPCREKELAAVKIRAADVDIIANELEVS